MKKFFCAVFSLLVSVMILFAEETTEKQSPEENSTEAEQVPNSTIYESSDKLLKNTESSSNAGLSFFAKTVKLLNSIPLAFDVGLEGASNGTVTYVSSVYSWTEYLHTRLNFEYERSLGYEHGTTLMDEIQLSPIENYTLQFYPAEHHIFFNKSHQSQFSYGAGVQYLQLNEKGNITGWLDGDVLNIASGSDELFAYKYLNETRSHLIGPIMRCYFRIPLTSFIVFNSETIINPINGFYSKSDADLFVTGKDISYKKSNSYDDFFWTFTDIKETVHLDFFNLFAIVMNYSFRRADYDYYELYNKVLPINGTSVNQNVFKVGASLVAVGKTYVRLKSGIYYEHKWSKNNITNERLYEGKWTVSLGLDF